MRYTVLRGFLMLTFSHERGTLCCVGSDIEEVMQWNGDKLFLFAIRHARHIITRKKVNQNATTIRKGYKMHVVEFGARFLHFVVKHLPFNSDIWFIYILILSIVIYAPGISYSVKTESENW